MSKRWVLTVIASAVALGIGAWAVSRGIERLAAPEPAATPSADAAPDAAQVPHISATLFFRAADDDSLVPVRLEVPLGEGVSEQAKHILSALMQTAPPQLISVVPSGTSLRGFYMTERGDAFVDLSAEATTKHPGGSTTELLTVYTLVNTMTANLPTIKRVQILIDGKEVDTLAGHVDLRHPLAPDMSFVRDRPGEPASQ